MLDSLRCPVTDDRPGRVTMSNPTMTPGWMPARQVAERVLAGTAAGTIAAFSACSILLGLTGPKGDTGTLTAFQGTVAGATLGAIAALARPRRRSRGEDWTGWRRLKVARRVKESQDITSFHLEPVDPGPLPPYLPGQFLTIRLEIPEIDGPAIRTYSLSDEPPDPSATRPHYRLSIKRESAPQGQDLPPGVASSFLHDHMPEGSILLARPPSGSFVLDLTHARPVALISNGVGITPMIAMLKVIARQQPERKVWFIHGARDGRFHAFREEVMETVQGRGNLAVHFAYSRPRPEDAGLYQSEGHIQADLIRSLVQGEADYFLCGSPPFLEAVRAGLNEAGVPEDCIQFEMFTKGARSAPAPTAAGSSQEPPASLPATVTFTRSQRTAEWNGSHETLLEFAEAQGLNPDFSCRAGLCGTCACRLLEGEVSYTAPPTAAVAPGSVLICISQPKTARLSLDL